MADLRKRGSQEREDAVTGDVAEGREFEGIVAAVELEAAGVGTMAAKGVEHLTAQLGEHGGVVLAIDEEGLAVGAHAALDVGHGADGRPVVAEFLDRDVVAKALPYVVGGHALADDVRVIGGKMQEAASFNGGIVHEGDVADGRAEAGTQNTEAG